MESSGQADFKTVPWFALWATFEGDIEGFTLLKVKLATTVLFTLTWPMDEFKCIICSCQPLWESDS